MWARTLRKPGTESSLRINSSAKSFCTAWTPRDRRKPVRYAVDGYGVLSCVIGGMTDSTRISESGIGRDEMLAWILPQTIRRPERMRPAWG